MKIRYVGAAVASLLVGAVHAGDLCKLNPYTKQEAQIGKAAFDSRCALCHQYSMTGRVPGNHEKEFPDIKTLTQSDLDFIDDSGGYVKPVFGPKFFNQFRNKSIAEFSAFVSSASISFPTVNFKVPDTYFHLAAYVLYRNCGKM